MNTITARVPSRSHAAVFLFALAQGAALTLLLLLAAIGLLLAAQNWFGSGVVALSGVGYLAALLVLVLLVSFVRLVWIRGNAVSQAARPRPFLWLAPLGVMAIWLLALAWPAESSIWGAAGLFFVAVEELAAGIFVMKLLRSSPTAVAAMSPSPSEAVASASPTAVPPLAKDSLPVEILDESEELPASVRQQFTRYLDEDGSDAVEGTLRIAIEPGQRLVAAHVSFCPPFVMLPQVQCHQQAGPEGAINIGQVETFGARFEIRLRKPSEEASDVVLVFSARATLSAAD